MTYQIDADSVKRSEAVIARNLADMMALALKNLDADTAGRLEEIVSELVTLGHFKNHPAAPFDGTNDLSETQISDYIYETKELGAKKPNSYSIYNYSIGGKPSVEEFEQTSKKMLEIIDVIDKKKYNEHRDSIVAIMKKDNDRWHKNDKQESHSDTQSN